MTDKVYIVVNKKQEFDILKKLEQNNLFWDEGEKPTEWVPSKEAFSKYHFEFPYTIIAYENDTIEWSYYSEDYKGNIVYDGRKEEKMSDKYSVTQEFMNELIEWRDEMNLNAKNEDFGSFVNGNDIQYVPGVVYMWWRRIEKPIERNNRLIAIIQWLNGEDVFEVEEPHKFVVRSDNPDEDGDYLYVEVLKSLTSTSYSLLDATRFNTREEAQEWANSHQVVVEIDEEGNEVEE